jgi:hypothetical protein
MDRDEVLAKIWEAYEAGHLIPVCAWCGCVRIEGEWFDLIHGDTAPVDDPMTLSHTICPRCMETQPTAATRRDGNRPP